MKETDFLKELKALYEKYGMIVDACGCCGSPYITNTIDVNAINGAIDHLKRELPEDK
jgi:hypothetical protein